MKAPTLLILLGSILLLASFRQPHGSFIAIRARALKAGNDCACSAPKPKGTCIDIMLKYRSGRLTSVGECTPEGFRVSDIDAPPVHFGATPWWNDYLDKTVTYTDSFAGFFSESSYRKLIVSKRDTLRTVADSSGLYWIYIHPSHMRRAAYHGRIQNCTITVIDTSPPRKNTSSDSLYSVPR